MQEFECHFSFKTVVQTHGRNEEGAIENIERMINDEVVNGASNILKSLVDYDHDDILVQEVENGWFELELFWSGYWNLDAENQTQAKETAEKWLNEHLTLFYQMLEIEADKRSRFELIDVKDETIFEVLESSFVTD